MNGQELTDRLINNIHDSIEIRKRVPDPHTQIKTISSIGNIDIKDFVSSLNTWDFDAHLDILSQFINLKERLVDHDKGSPVDINIFYRDTVNHKSKISQQFQEILDNADLIDITSGQRISKHLRQQLDWIDNAAK